MKGLEAGQGLEWGKQALRPQNGSRQVHHPEKKLCHTLVPACLEGTSAGDVEGALPWGLPLDSCGFPALHSQGLSCFSLRILAQVWLKHGSGVYAKSFKSHSLCIRPGRKALATWSLWSYKTEQVLEHQVQLTLMIDLTPGVLFTPLLLPVPLSTMGVWHFQQEL